MSEAVAKKLDWWLPRWTLTLIPLIAVPVLIFYVPSQKYILQAVALYGGLLCIYFARILLWRIQCSLLELLAMVCVFGMVTGLVVSTPGARTMGLWLAPAIGAWVLHGAVVGLVRSSLREIDGARGRLWQMSVAWAGGAAIALIATGVLIFAVRHVDEKLLTAELRMWGYVLPGVGLIGWVWNIVEGMRAEVVARGIGKMERAG